LKKDMPNGIVLYEGRSRLDGQLITAIATGFKGNNNHKIGDMIQVWILRSNIHPCNAKTDGDDFSICGDCKHKVFGSCYVELKRGPMGIYARYLKDFYPKMHKKYLSLFHGKHIRWGAYGDPAALPFRIIKKYSDLTVSRTGYTHQWQKSKNSKYKNYLMASVDSTLGYYKEFKKAHDMGWRTFRATTSKDTVIFDNEFICPASKEGGLLTTCQRCNACNGAQNNRKNPIIRIHGTSYKVDHFERGMQALKNKKKYKKSWNKHNKVKVTPIVQDSIEVLSVI